MQPTLQNQVFMGGEIVVNANELGGVTDPASNLLGLGRNVEPVNCDLA
jgi:hypothetical protein